MDQVTEFFNSSIKLFLWFLKTYSSDGFVQSTTLLIMTFSNFSLLCFWKKSRHLVVEALMYSFYSKIVVKNLRLLTIMLFNKSHHNIFQFIPEHSLAYIFWRRSKVQ